MNNTYIIRKESLNEVLNDISNFEDVMKVFINKHKDFIYKVSLDNEDEDWVVKINIQNKNEQSNIEVFKDVTRAR